MFALSCCTDKRKLQNIRRMEIKHSGDLFVYRQEGCTNTKTKWSSQFPACTEIKKSISYLKNNLQLRTKQHVTCSAAALVYLKDLDSFASPHIYQSSVILDTLDPVFFFLHFIMGQRLSLYLALGRPCRCWDDLLWCSDSHWRQMSFITESCAPSAAWRTSWTNGPARLGSSFTACRYAGRSLLQSRKALICTERWCD